MSTDRVRFRPPGTERPISNGRKIARIAPISTIFGPNESSRRDLFLEKKSKERNERKDFEKFKNFSKKLGICFTDHVRIVIFSTPSRPKLFLDVANFWGQQQRRSTFYSSEDRFRDPLLPPPLSPLRVASSGLRTTNLFGWRRRIIFSENEESSSL